MDCIFFILGLCVSKIYTAIILSKKVGEAPYIKITMWPLLYNSMIFIPCGMGYAIHVHHWIFYLLILCFYKILPVLLCGFCVGMIIDGLGYNDRFSIIENSPY